VGGGEDETGKKKGKVRKTPAGEEKKCGERGSVTTTTDSIMSSDVLSVQSLCRRGGPGEGGVQQRGGEEESKREREEHVLPFYRGICACTDHVHVRAMRAARLDKYVLARSRATLCASTFLQVVVAVSFQKPARDDNGNVETKPVCSSLLHIHNLASLPLITSQLYLCIWFS